MADVLSCELIYLMIIYFFSFSVADMTATTFFKQPFKSLVLPKHLVEYTVMNIEPISENDRHRFSGQGTISKRVRNILHKGAFTNYVNMLLAVFEHITKADFSLSKQVT